MTDRDGERNRKRFPWLLATLFPVVDPVMFTSIVNAIILTEITFADRGIGFGITRIEVSVVMTAQVAGLAGIVQRSVSPHRISQEVLKTSDHSAAGADGVAITGH